MAVLCSQTHGGTKPSTRSYPFQNTSSERHFRDSFFTRAFKSNPTPGLIILSVSRLGNRSENPMLEEALSKLLSPNLLGSVITPASDKYEASHKVYNGMIDRRPDAIVRCANAADVRAAVNFARQECVTVAVRGGGH